MAQIRAGKSLKKVGSGDKGKNTGDAGGGDLLAQIRAGKALKKVGSGGDGARGDGIGGGSGGGGVGGSPPPMDMFAEVKCNFLSTVRILTI